MKKFALLVLAAGFFAACSEDPNSEDQVQLDDMPFVEADLSKMTPSLSFDNDIRGTYTGIIASLKAEIHGKLFLNIANDGNYGALLVTSDEKITFDLTSSTKTSFTFESELGSFTLDASDLNNPSLEVKDMRGLKMVGHVKKDRHGSRFGIILGTYSGSIYSGVWDFFLDLSVSPFIEDVFISLPSGHTIVESNAAGDFEADVTSCYGPDPFPPFFLTDNNPPLPTDTSLELYLIGQTRVLPNNGTTLLYDFAFSKQACDLFYGGDYNRMYGSPQVTNNFWFDPPLAIPSCYNIPGALQGLWALEITGTGTAFDQGFINIDTSTFVPVPPTSALVGDTPTAIDATLRTDL